MHILFLFLEAVKNNFLDLIEFLSTVLGAVATLVPDFPKKYGKKALLYISVGVFGVLVGIVITLSAVISVLGLH